MGTQTTPFMSTSVENVLASIFKSHSNQIEMSLDSDGN